MQIISFNYTDTKGRVSTRTLAVHSSPSSMYTGTDISELEPSDMVEYAQKARLAKEKYLAEMSDIENQFDLNHRYRQFKSDSMKNIIKQTY